MRVLGFSDMVGGLEIAREDAGVQHSKSSLDRADRLETTRDVRLRIDFRQRCVQPDTIRGAFHGTYPEIRQRRRVPLNYWMHVAI